MSPCTSDAARVELPSERRDGVRCPRCGAPAHKRIHPADEPERAAEDFVFSLPTDASDAMVDCVVHDLRGWGLGNDPATAAAVRDCLNRALVILQREIDYRWK